MKIAVASQNRKTVTGHAGKCRKFWLFDVQGAEVLGKRLLELPMDQTFHASHGSGSHPLQDVNVLIAGGMGTGLQQRLKQKGILAVATAESDPERAVAAWLDGSLVEIPPELHGHAHDHGHAHSHASIAQPFQFPLDHSNNP